MAFYDMNYTASTGRLRRMVAQLTTQFLIWREQSATRKALGRLTDQELNDIGLLRSDLDDMSGSGMRDG